MTQINPFTGAIIVGSHVQQTHGAEKQRQLRRMQNLRRDAALAGDELHHQVESSDTLQPAQDQREGNPQRREGDGPDPDHPHVDVTA